MKKCNKKKKQKMTQKNVSVLFLIFFLGGGGEMSAYFSLIRDIFIGVKSFLIIFFLFTKVEVCKGNSIQII